MDCSGGSFDTVGSGSFDMTSAHSSFDHVGFDITTDNKNRSLIFIANILK